MSALTVEAYFGLPGLVREGTVLVKTEVKSDDEQDSAAATEEDGPPATKRKRVKQEEKVNQELIPQEATTTFETLKFMYGRNDPTKLTGPTQPFTTRFPEFPSIPNRLVPHPLDSTSWGLDPSTLALLPPSHLFTLDNGSSLFDVDFSRQPNDVGGNPQAMVDKKHRHICFSGFQSPVPSPGGPYVHISRADWPNMGIIQKDGQPFSLFYGGGLKHTNCWRYRGEIAMDLLFSLRERHPSRRRRQDYPLARSDVRFALKTKFCTTLHNNSPSRGLQRDENSKLDEQTESTNQGE
ncbi:hypothetical protein JCM3765_003062 [Sporobolomyces pararoseus]